MVSKLVVLTIGFFVIASKLLVRIKVAHKHTVCSILPPDFTCLTKIPHTGDKASLDRCG